MFTQGESLFKILLAIIVLGIGIFFGVMGVRYVLASYRGGDLADLVSWLNIALLMASSLFSLRVAWRLATHPKEVFTGMMLIQMGILLMVSSTALLMFCFARQILMNFIIGVSSIAFAFGAVSTWRGTKRYWFKKDRKARATR